MGGRDAIQLLATIAQQLTRIADAAELMSGGAAIAQQRETEQQREKKPDVLQAILGNRQLYDDVVYWASTCERPRDITNRIAPILKREGFNRFNKAFVDALLPHLTQYTGRTNYYKNMLKLFY